MEGGFSAIEVAVASMLMVAVVAIFGPVLTSSLEAGQVVSTESRGLDEIRVAVARIDKELRSASCITLPSANAAAARLTFVTKAGTAGDYEVTYQVSGDQLIRTVGAQSSVVGEGIVVTNEEFRHESDPGQRAKVEISLQVQFDDNRTPRSVTTTIAGRNAWGAC